MFCDEHMRWSLAVLYSPLVNRQLSKNQDEESLLITIYLQEKKYLKDKFYMAISLHVEWCSSGNGLHIKSSISLKPLQGDFPQSVGSASAFSPSGQ